MGWDAVLALPGPAAKRLNAYHYKALPGLVSLTVIAGLDPAIHAAPVRNYWLYILASKRNGTLYVGVTNNLIRRMYEHQRCGVAGFTKQYDVKMLVYYERYDTALAAIQREKNIKHWSRRWKIDLVRKMNPAWRDLTKEITR